MATAIYMPKAGMAMEEGTLIRWLKNVGDHVEMNEPVMEIETDKIAMESEAPATGILLKTLVGPGTVVPVLETIGWIGEAGEKIPEGAESAAASAHIEVAPAGAAPSASQVPAATGADVAATPYARSMAREKNVELGLVPPTGRHGEVIGADVLGFAAKESVKATPLAAAIAAKNGLDLAGVPGSGYGGKVTKDDVMPLVSGTPAAKSAPAVQQDAGETKTKLSGMRRVIAERMMRSYLEIPAVTQSTEIDVTELLSLREKINSKREKPDRITVNDFILRAVAMACRAFPAFRSRLEEENVLVTSERVNVGVAVSTDNGLLVPVVFDADRLSLTALSLAAKDVAARARSNKLSPDECVGSTITVSNLGMFGVTSFTPIINQPNSAIVGVCAVKDVVALSDTGTLSVKKMLNVCITLDHRIMDGAVAARFAVRMKELLENPLDMLI